MAYLQRVQACVVEDQYFEPRRGETNNVVSEQARYKPGCTIIIIIIIIIIMSLFKEDDIFST